MSSAISPSSSTTRICFLGSFGMSVTCPRYSRRTPVCLAHPAISDLQSDRSFFRMLVTRKNWALNEKSHVLNIKGLEITGLKITGPRLCYYRSMAPEELQAENERLRAE